MISGDDDDDGDDDDGGGGRAGGRLNVYQRQRLPSACP